MSRSVILSDTLPQVPILIEVVKIVKYVKIASFSAGVHLYSNWTQQLPSTNILLTHQHHPVAG